MKKLLITGGTGFFGKSILDFLSENNSDFDITIISRKGMDISKYQNIKIFQIFGDIQSIKLNESYDYIIHAATPAVVDVSDDEMQSIILNGMKNLISQVKCTSPAAKILFTSSGAVYGNYTRKVSEKDECYPITVYGYAKLEAEKLLIDSGLKCSIARCFAFSGKNLNQNIHFAIGNFIKNARLNEDIIIKSDGTSVRSYLDQKDLSAQLLKILIDGKDKEIYNVGSDKNISIKELAFFIKDNFNPNINIQILGKTNFTNTKNYYVPNVNKIKEDLGCFQHIELKDSLMSMYNI